MAAISPELHQQLLERFTVVKLTNTAEVNVKCPACKHRGMGDDGSGKSPAGHLGLNFQKNKGYCVRCGYRIGNVRQWLRRRSIEVPFDERELRNFKPDVLGGDIVDAHYKEQEVRLPDGCYPISADDPESWEAAYSLYDKGVTPEELLAAKCYYATHGKCAGYVVFPFYEDEQLVYWQGRAFAEHLKDDPRKRKLNPKDEEMPNGLGKSCWLYGVDDATVGGEIYLVEGTLDRATVHTFVRQTRGEEACACALQGTNLSFPDGNRHWLNTQFGKLLALDPKLICVLFDPDAVGKANILADELRSCGLPAYAGRCPDERDPNELHSAPDLLAIALQPINDRGLRDLDFATVNPRL